MKLKQGCASFANPCIIPLFRLPSLVNITPRYLNFSNCCSVLQRTVTWVSKEVQYLCTLVLIFIPAFTHSAENRAVLVENPILFQGYMVPHFLMLNFA